MTSIVYLDSSALLKLVAEEPESTALRRYWQSLRQRVSSALARAEVLRAAYAIGPEPLVMARDVLRRVNLLTIDKELLERAAFLEPLTLRTLDAIHLASALAVGSELEEVVTYDKRMAEAAFGLGLRVVAPR